MPPIFKLLRVAALVTASLSASGAARADTPATGVLTFRVPVNSLAVTPTTGIAQAGPTVLDFGNQTPGVTSPALQAVLRNVGTEPFSVAGIQASGPFSVSADCPASLDAGQSCAANVTFTPPALGAGAGDLEFSTGVGTQTVSLRGLGAQYLAAISPLTLDFGDDPVGSATAQNTVTLSNAGNLPLPVSSAETTGPFVIQANDCGSSLAASSMCSYQLAFQPTVMGNATGSLTVVTAAGTRKVSFKGVGLQGNQDVSVGALSFPATLVGSTSAGQGVALENTGNIALPISSVTVSGPYAVSYSCPSSLDAGANCVANVVFKPLAMGDVTGQLTFTTSLGARLVSLSGTGLQAILASAPAALAFGDEPVGTAAAAQVVTLTNSGNAPASLSLSSLSAPFSVASTTCGASLPASASCVYSVTFTPTAMGQVSGVLAIASDAGAQSIALSGNGQQASGALALGSLDFDNQTVGTKSTAQSITVNNTGNVPLAFNGATVSGPFEAANNCSSPIAVGASCSVNIMFSPVAPGAQNGVLTVATAGGNYTANLAGTGTQAILAAAPAALNFSSVTVGSASAAQGLTLSNTGNISSGISAASVTGPFSIVSTSCGGALAAGTSCAYTVAFSPVAMGNATGSLSIPTDVGVQVVALAGAGQQTSATLNPAALAFGSQAVSTSSAAQPATMTNTGNTPLGIAGVTTTGQFTATHNCPATLAAGASCTANVEFASTSMGAQAGTLSVATSAGSYTTNLSGTGLLAVVAATPSTVAFGDQAVGSASASQTVTLSNTGNTAASVSAAHATGPFAFTTTCGAALAANSNCTYSVTFNPTAMNGASGTLTLQTSAGTASIALSGNGLQASASLPAGTLAFGNQPVNTVSTADTLTLVNTGNVPYPINSVTVVGQFTVQQNCGTSIAVGGSCYINVAFLPTAMGAQTGTLSLVTGDGTHVVSLTGTGQQTSGSLSQTAVSFGNQAVSATSSAQAVTVSNTGNTALSLTGITATAQFSQTNNCPSSLAVGGTCTVNVAFTPTSQGAQSGSLTVATAAGSYTAALSGTGLKAVLTASPTALSFGTQQTATAVVKSFTLSNTGNTAATSIAITVPSAYGATSNCGTSLAANASCVVQVTFNPPAATAYNGTVSIASSAPTVGVSVTGTGGVSTFALSTGSIPLPMANVGTTTTGTFSITNTGNVAGTPTITATSNFSATQCASIAPGASCTATVYFTPSTSQTASKNYSGTVSVAGSSAGTQNIAVSGTGAMSTATSAVYATGSVPVYSPNQQYALVMQGDCNLVVYHGAMVAGNGIWSTDTASGNPTCVLDVQTDGNLVIYTSTSSVPWNSGTGGHGNQPTFIQLSNTGVLSMYLGTPSAPGQLMWQN